MRWSKLRALVVERFAEPLKGRLDIHSTRYGNCSCGHAWITLDGVMIANFCTRAYWTVDYTIPTYGPEPGFKAAANPMYDKQLAAYGERSRQQVYQTLWDFVHSVSIEAALASDDMLLQALAIVDSRVGKRRLGQLDVDALHPLCAYLLLVRTGQADAPSPAEFIALRERNAPSRSVAA